MDKSLNYMNLFGSTKKLMDKIKNGEISLKVVEVVLVQYNVVDNPYQQKSEMFWSTKMGGVTLLHSINLMFTC